MTPHSQLPETSTGGAGWLARAALGIVFAFIAAAAVASALMAYYALTPGPGREEEQVTVFIPKGASVREIGTLLEDAGLVRAGVRFSVLTKIMGLSTRLQAGEFSLTAGQRPVDLIRQLVEARPVVHFLTVPEGLRLAEIAALYARQGWADEARFLELSRDRTLIEELGLGGISSLEGYLYPDTYALTRPAEPEERLLEMMTRRALEVWKEVAPAPVRLGRHETFTLASIVEKETGRPEERPLIASVFLNRLKKGMRLQADPTVSYGLAGFSGPLTRADLQTPTPYNTYIIPGLPPGPICSPGKEALRAVLQPADSDYLYFVSKNDGSHHFSRNLREHNRAVRMYQR